VSEELVYLLEERLELQEQVGLNIIISFYLPPPKVRSCIRWSTKPEIE